MIVFIQAETSRVKQTVAARGMVAANYCSKKMEDFSAITCKNKVSSPLSRLDERVAQRDYIKI